jgi:glucose/arabinose dehydrogenase
MKTLHTAILLTLSFTILAVDAHAQINDTPLPIQAERAFPNLRLRRPTIFTHAGDGTNRIFVASQQGVIQVFPNDQDVKDVKVFLDIESRVVYKDKENEEGLLGFAFHPKYKQNGQFFLYYTTADAPHTSVVSRFRVSQTDPDKADPTSEEELLRIPQPFWNHNGGALAFGPDGYLYIALGDGGSARDPHGNGQNLETLLGSILRIDVDRKDEGKSYAIPKDNPFVGREKARPEIWAYGLRNVWGMSFDRATGTLWAADVGQDIWEEIDIIVRGGNYGWNLREGFHKFGDKGADPRADLIEPVWEYHHNIGKSITGGYVYRGKRLPELAGTYLYADYVSGKLWALRYDEKAKKVVANYSLRDNKMPVIAFGEDQDGDVYFTDAFGMIYRFSRIAAAEGQTP